MNDARGRQTPAAASSGVVYDLATSQDDAAIRRLLATNPVPGDVTLAYAREPDYFAGNSVLGPFCQTIVARASTGEILAVATRSVRRRFVNGAPEDVGYIGQLRVEPRHRGRWLVSGGFRHLRRLHEDGRVRGYITTIIEGNREAEGILVTRARRSLPVYREFDRLCTMALILSRLPELPVTGFELRTGDEVDLDDVVAFINRAGASRQFCPVYTSDDFRAGTLRGLLMADMLVACRQGRIVGALGLWDQGAFKQTIVRAYSPALHRIRPLYNLLARLTGASALTPIGEAIPTVYGALLRIDDDDRDVFAGLLAHAARRAARRRYAYLTIGLSARDPLLRGVRRRLHIPYYSRAYTVCWPGDDEFHSRLDRRVPYLEISAL